MVDFKISKLFNYTKKGLQLRKTYYFIETLLY